MRPVKSGLDVLESKRFASLRGARIGVISHQASVNARLIHVIDLLRQYKMNVVALFAPEHGLWGTAQDQVEIAAAPLSMGAQKASPGPETPVFSLYGERRVPTEEHLRDVDILLCDLQDVGSRYYTFIWTMALAMQACAKYGKKFVVIDRPNPIGGLAMEGPVLDLNFASFVGLYALPVRHGMTTGEVARWVNATYRIGAELEVVAMEGWRRRMLFDETGLPWVLPSPNMPSLETALVYPGGCLIEGTNLSEGRGTTRPFELLGAPFIIPEELWSRLNAQRLPGVLFRPCRFEPTFHKFQGQVCGGVQLHVTDRRTFKGFLTTLVLIQQVFKLYPQQFAWRDPPYEYEKEKWPFDILCGQDRIRKTIEGGRPVQRLERFWRQDIARFHHQRKPFLLYN